MHLRSFALAAVIAATACSTPRLTPAPASTSPAVGPIAPETRDPGVVEDTPPLQSGPPPHAGSASGSDIVRGDTGKPDGAQCLLDTDCASSVCEGQGCSNDKPGTCAPKQRICTEDLRPYCGCDGKTFRTSGTCPGRRYSARNACSS